MSSLRYPPLQSGYTYHIFNQGNNSENLFKSPRNYPYFLEKYQKNIHPLVDTFAFCFPPNHFHLLIRVKPYQALHQAFPKKFPFSDLLASSAFDLSTKQEFDFDNQISALLSKQFAGWFSGYTRAINIEQNRKGKLFSQPFERIIVQNEMYFSCLIAYIHRNPIHHHFCDRFENWSYSSYQPILDFFNGANQSPQLRNNSFSFSMIASKILNLPFLMDWFGDSAHFLQVHRDSLGVLDEKYFLE